MVEVQQNMHIRRVANELPQISLLHVCLYQFRKFQYLNKNKK